MRQKEQRRDDDDRPQYAEVPRMKDEKPWFGPTDRDGSIKVKYPSINGYGVDSDQLQQMEKMGLPTGFTFGQTQPERQRKGDKKSFYCEICLVELNSLETMKSHVAGVSIGNWSNMINNCLLTDKTHEEETAIGSAQR